MQDRYHVIPILNRVKLQLGAINWPDPSHLVKPPKLLELHMPDIDRLDLSAHWRLSGAVLHRNR
jgi:hypothetical protein